MKQLSYWASQHKTAARIIIVLLYIPLNIAGLITGYLLQETGVNLGAYFIYSVITLVLLAYFFYPKKTSYYKRKFVEGIMITSTFFMICFYGNQLNNPAPVFPFYQSTHAVSYTIANAVAPSVNDSKKTLTKKEYKKELKQSLRKKKEMAKGWKIVLIILSILVAAGLIYLFLVLGCSIACSGSEALAIVVVLIGSAATIFGLIKLIKLINGKNRRRN